MNISGLCVAVLAVVAIVNGSLLDALNAAHSNPEFNKLPHADQVLILELLAEVETGEVKAYIDQVGFSRVLAVIDKLPAAEAHTLTHYLVLELQIEENVTMPVVGKRDLVSTLNQVLTNPTFQHLPLADQELIKKMVTAAENHTLSALVQQVGYSTILQLLDVLPQQERHAVEHYLIQHLNKEEQLLG